MKEYTRTVTVQRLGFGEEVTTTVKAYNDSGSEWVCECNGITERYLQRKHSMKQAIRLTAELHGHRI